MNERPSFEEVVAAHVDVVWSLARRLTRDHGEAEDLLQDTFLRAFAGFGRWRGGDPRAWLVVICLNAARDTARRASARPREVVDVTLAEPVGSDDPCEEALRRLDRDRVERAIGLLPPEQRVAIELVDLVGLTAQAAADALGCPRGTVLARVHRGRRRLARLLEWEGVRDDS
jgi:RNA polymerase sigma-70 factor (ECF subfamily)